MYISNDSFKQVIFSEVDVLSKMNTSRLVPLYNLIQYHISRGAHECKHTEQVSTHVGEE